MSKRILIVVLALIVVSLAISSSASAGGRPFSTDLSGAEEVNSLGVPNQGDLDGSGFASLTFNRGTGQVCFTLTVEDITLPAIGAHIHAAPAGSNGPVVVPLTSPDESGFSSSCVSADRELVKAITKNPSDYYVNVHTTDFPAGALRGQLGD